MSSSFQPNSSGKPDLLYKDFEAIPESIRLVLSSVSDGIVVTDRYGRLVLCNKKAQAIMQKIFGQVPEQGAWLRKIFPAERRIELQAHFNQALEGQAVTYEVQLTVTHSVKPLWLRCAYQPMYTQTEVSGVCVYVKDISPEKELAKTEKEAAVMATELKRSKMLLQTSEVKNRALLRSVAETAEEEKRLLALKLHDHVAQILSSCKLMLDVASNDAQNAPQLMAKTAQSLNTVIDEIRSICQELKPSAIKDIGLVDAISEMLFKIKTSRNFIIQFDHHFYEREEGLPYEDKVAVYRVVQELMANVLQHSHAQFVRVNLLSNDRRIFISISDDGVGFDAGKILKGTGLKSVSYRAGYYKGKMKLQTIPGKGCKVKVVLQYERH